MWKYGIRKVGRGAYVVCEVYHEMNGELAGATENGVKAYGDTPHELLRDLLRMANDVAAAIEEKEIYE